MQDFDEQTKRYWKNPKIVDEIELDFSIRSGAKECKTCRSRKMLQNAYLDAKIGFDRAVKGPVENRLLVVGT